MLKDEQHYNGAMWKKNLRCGIMEHEEQGQSMFMCGTISLAKEKLEKLTTVYM